MSLRSEPRSPLSPAWIVGAYLVGGGLWILLAETVLRAISTTRDPLAWPRTAERLLFVLVTAVLLALVLRRRRGAAANGEERHLAGSAAEVTRLTELPAGDHHAVQAHKMEAVGRLAGGVAHDFNNLLTVMTGYAELLRSRVGPSSRGAVEEIVKAAERAADLTQQLLAFSRRQVLKPRILDLNAVLRRQEAELRRVLGEATALETSLSSTLGSVRADLEQLERVLLNLAVNAHEAMPKGGALKLTTDRVELAEPLEAEDFVIPPGSYSRLRVVDTGIGMDAATRARVFEPFFTTKQATKNAGLGLSTAYGIVKQSGGFIGVESEPERGTAVTVYLPEVAGEEVQSPGRSQQEPDLRGWETILVAEDEAGIRELVVEGLRSYGYEVVSASNGREALDAAVSLGAPVHLLLTDVVMDDMGGVELQRRLQARYPGLVTLFMSGYSDRELEERGRKRPARLLSKPFTVAELVTRVREVLDSP